MAEIDMDFTRAIGTERGKHVVSKSLGSIIDTAAVVCEKHGSSTGFVADADDIALLELWAKRWIYSGITAALAH